MRLSSIANTLCTIAFCSRHSRPQDNRPYLCLGQDGRYGCGGIQNIVGSCDVKFPIRLPVEGLSYSHGEFSSYEPKECYLNARIVFIPWTHLLVVKTSPRSWEGLGSIPSPATFFGFNNRMFKPKASCAPDFRIGEECCPKVKTSFHPFLAMSGISRSLLVLCI